MCKRVLFAVGFGFYRYCLIVVLFVYEIVGRWSMYLRSIYLKLFSRTCDQSMLARVLFGVCD